jgi:class 3 adenylate cyclase
MLALYRCGRQADALDTYHEGRRVLDEQLGLRPSRALRELEERILRQDPAIAPPAASAPTVAPSPVPRKQATTRYARNGDVSLGYQVFGTGELELLVTAGWVLPMELSWDNPTYVRFLERLGSFARVLLWDKRGTGLSDRFAPGQLPTLDERISDMVAVMDAAGFERPALFGLSEGALLSALFAARHPDRTRAIALYGGWARTMQADGYPWGATPEWFDRLTSFVSSNWADATPLLRYWAPGSQGDVAMGAWWTRALHLGASPTAAVHWLRIMVDQDIRDELPAIRAPALVMHRTDDAIVPVGHSRYLGEHIPGAEYLELSGSDHLWFVGDHEQLLEPVQRFLTGSLPAPATERVLLTVLFTDIVDSTRRASEAGDRAWRFLQSQHDRAVRSEIARHNGREVKAMGDGFLATFDGPTRAVRCAAAIRDAAAAIGLDVRAGLHTGEVELVGDDIAGIAVNIGARVCALAGPGDVLVSRTVVDLVAGSGLEFEARGEHELAGLPGSFALLALQR